MQIVLRILTTAVLIAIFVLSALHLRAASSRSPLPARVPPPWAATDTTRCAWIFVRRGCDHCAAHLAALARAAASRPAGRRQELLDRIHVVGDSDRVPSGVRRETDRPPWAAGVQTTPTTILVDAEGHVLEMWRGARGNRAWERALDLLEAGTVPP